MRFVSFQAMILYLNNLVCITVFIIFLDLLEKVTKIIYISFLLATDHWLSYVM